MPPYHHCVFLYFFALRYEAHPVHGSYSWFLYYAPMPCLYVIYMYISMPPLRVHTSSCIGSSIIPYSSAHLHPYVRLHPQRYILTDGARPKLKGISHLGRIWVCPFLPRHHLPNLDILLIHDSTIRFAPGLSSSSYAKVSTTQVCPSSLVVHPPGRGNPIAGHVHDSAGSVGIYSLWGHRIVCRSFCFRG